jgi:opacity protein-like surface antigen
MSGSLRFVAAATAVALVSWTNAGFAQGMGGQWYVKAFGGATFPDGDDFELTDRLSGDTFDTGLDYDTGYVLGIAAGYDVMPNLAIELEYAYRNADATFKDTGGDVGSTTESNAWMVNAIYKLSDLGTGGQWQPYIGGGLGVADVNVEDINFDGLNFTADADGDYNFAYQLIGGVAYSINPNLALNGEVRFFGVNDQDYENDDISFKTTYQTLDLLFGVTYRF